MIVYRVQASTPLAGWVTQWESSFDAAKRTARQLAGVGYDDVHVDRVRTIGGYEGMIAALNQAQDNRENWPGEELAWGDYVSRDGGKK